MSASPSYPSSSTSARFAATIGFQPAPWHSIAIGRGAAIEHQRHGAPVAGNVATVWRWRRSVPPTRYRRARLQSCDPPGRRDVAQHLLGALGGYGRRIEVSLTEIRSQNLQ